MFACRFDMNDTCQLSVSVDSQPNVTVSNLVSAPTLSMSSIVFGKSNTDQSFGGCLYDLMIGEAEVDMITDSINAVNIGMLVYSKQTLSLL